MFTVQSLLNIVGVILSLTPFLGVGFYFGRLEKRIKTMEKNHKNHNGRLQILEQTLGV